MWSKWYSPKTLEQQSSDEIAYTGGLLKDFTANFVSDSAVVGVATSLGGLVQLGAQSLVFRNFGIENQGTVIGVEVQLSVDRLSRIQDQIVQLWTGSAVGRNLADPMAEDRWVYTGDLARWRVDTLAVDNENFGVLIDLQAHKQYPSKNMIYVRDVKIRVNFG
jgi:hypothetical protein